MFIEQELKLDFNDVLIRPKRSSLKSRKEVDLEREYKFLHSTFTWQGVPIIASNMDHTGTFDMANVLSSFKMLTAISKFAHQDEWLNNSLNNPSVLQDCFATTGIKERDIESITTILQKIKCPFICIDVANGYTERFVDFVKKMRERFPNHIIMAGNVVTGEMVEQLVLSGADIVKIGIGPGSACTTRTKTGIGYPQLSAIIACADAAHGVKGHVCADGGCRIPGDVVKAFAAGADFVMIGGIFAGHDECAGHLFEKNGKQYKQFYGMSSIEAMLKYHGKIAQYRASEGKSIDVPHQGPVKNTIQDILGGLRSACTYVGAARLKELSKRTTFIRVNRQRTEMELDC